MLSAFITGVLRRAIDAGRLRACRHAADMPRYACSILFHY